MSRQPEQKYTGPTVRLVGEDGLVIYPRMVPDGKGDWMISNPEVVREMLHGSSENPPSTKPSGKPSSSSGQGDP